MAMTSESHPRGGVVISLSLPSSGGNDPPLSRCDVSNAGVRHVGDRARPLLLEQIVERRLRPRQLRTVLRDIGPRLGLEVIAKIRLILFAHLLRRGLLAMLGIRRVVLNAHLAHMQLRITRLTDVEPSERQTERGERRAAAPTNERVSHEELALHCCFFQRSNHHRETSTVRFSLGVVADLPNCEKPIGDPPKKVRAPTTAQVS